MDEEDLQKLEALTQGGRQKQNHVNESGLYALIFGSTKDEAKRFKRWVTHNVQFLDATDNMLIQRMSRNWTPLRRLAVAPTEHFSCSAP